MIDSLFTLYCEDCEIAGRPSRLWVRAEIELASSRGPEMQHYLECMNCGFRFKSCMDRKMVLGDTTRPGQPIGKSNFACRVGYSGYTTHT